MINVCKLYQKILILSSLAGSFGNQRFNLLREQYLFINRYFPDALAKKAIGLAGICKAPSSCPTDSLNA